MISEESLSSFRSYVILALQLSMDCQLLGIHGIQQEYKIPSTV